ncbi:MAG: SurA N-terminal domain-containing protein [Deltaproteobacteria bacterium]|nr:SurA N-terminal domain-containing protein [Deltaproteobacteria bacterium]
MRRAAGPLAFFLLVTPWFSGSSFAGPAPDGYRLVEATAASVNGEVIFLTDLTREACLYRCGAYAGETPKDLSMTAVRDRLIADTLVLQEQKKLGLGELDNAALAAALAAGERRMAGCASPCAKTVAEKELQAFDAKRMLVKEFLARRVVVFVEVGEGEVEQEVRSRRSRAGVKPEDVTPEKVRAELLEERTDRGIRNWFDRAASKARIILSPLEKP